jgi:hypothetical protein
MTAKPLEIEGTWEEIVSHSDALAGGQVRVGEGAIMGGALSGVFMSQQPTDDPHNLHLLSTLRTEWVWEGIDQPRRTKVDLIGIDPTFDVGANFSMNVAIGEAVYER